MFRMTRQQRRRWTLPLLVVFLLHWFGGVAEAGARVICLEPGGKVNIEFVGKPCSDDAKGSHQGEHGCIDVPLDNGHPEHSTSHGVDAKVSVASVQSVALFYLLPMPTAAPFISVQALAPPATNHPAVLRETTVLRI